MKTMNRSAPPADLAESIRYCPRTGEFTWLRTCGPMTSGCRAGHVNGTGYLAIRFRKRTYQAHRLAWFSMTGDWPDLMIDHVNLDPLDNRFSNLRLASPSQQSANRGLCGQSTKGVTLRRSGRFEAQIKHLGKTIYLGTYDTEEQAAAAYIAGARLYFGEFARAA